MTGTIFLGGGGSGEDERLLWERMLQDSPRTLYWPFALSGATLAGARGWLDAQLAALSVDLGTGAAIDLEVWDSLDERDPAALADVDLLFIGGGNTFGLLDHVRRHGFLEPVRQFVRDGGSLYGGSAGAILAGADISSAEGHDANDVGLTDWNALDLLGGRVVVPHYLPEYLAETRSLATSTGRTVLAVPERGGIVVDNGRFHATGPDSCWTIDATTTEEHPAGSAW